MSRFFAFIAGFFRNNAAESSARFVCIASCIGAIVYAFTHDPTPGTLAQTALLFTNGLVALGLRKGPAGETMTETSATATIASVTSTVTSAPASPTPTGGGS